VFPGCPLGCYVAVNTNAAANVESKAKELIDDGGDGTMGCAYECKQPPPVACQGGGCTLAFTK
jgi:hypothetical protein